MMRKYGLDEGTLYVEGNTLLEPNNFIPSWVSRSAFEFDLIVVSFSRRLVTKRRKRFPWPSRFFDNSTMTFTRRQLKRKKPSNFWRKESSKYLRRCSSSRSKPAEQTMKPISR